MGISNLQRYAANKLARFLRNISEKLARSTRSDEYWSSGLGDRLLAEAALRSSEERFRQLAEHIGEVFWLATSGLDQVIYVSPAYEQVWGQSCASLYDRPRAMLDAVHPLDSERVAAHLGALPEPSVEEYRIRRPDGELRWIGSRAFPIRDQAGSVYRVAVLAQDITERRHAEETLEQQYREAERARGEARAVLDATSDGVLLVSSAGQLLSANRRVNELFGIAADALVGRPAADLQAAIRHSIDDPDALFARLNDLASDDAQPFAVIVVQRAPVRRELAVFSAPVWSARQALLGRLFAFRDVTHERAVDRMKSEFVSLVSHELRTPLTSIKGYIDFLLEGTFGPPLADEQRELLSIVKESAGQLVVIVNDLLDAARIESGHLEVRLAPLDVKAVIVGVANMLRPQITAKRQELQLTLPCDLPLAHGDAPRVAQIVTNLLSNAHKYTPAAGRISVSAHADDAWVRVAVHDTGVGLSGEERAQIFKRFFRASNRATREASGTGLGLAITRSLVELHGGTIDVASAPGEGTTFRFTLPVAPNAQETRDD